MILSKEYNSSILSENIQTGFLKAEDCEKMQQLLTKKLIVILKNTETEKRETLQLISNYIPECYSQAQLNNLNTTNYKHKNIIIFEGLPYSDMNFMGNFFNKIHLLRRDFFLINEDIRKLHTSDFINHIILDRNFRGTLIFEVIGNTIDDVYNSLAEMLLHHRYRKFQMKEAKKIIQNSVEGLIIINTNNNRETGIVDIIIQ